MVSLLQHMLTEELRYQHIQFLAESIYDRSGAMQLKKDILQMKSCKDIFEIIDYTLYLMKPVDCPTEVINLINKVKREASRGIHSIYINMHQNYRSFRSSRDGRKFEEYGYISAFDLSSKVDDYVYPKYTIYHVCPGKYVEQIKREGLKARQAEFNNGNNDVPNKKRMFSAQVFCYKALFAVRKWQECRELARTLNIKYPHMVKFLPGQTTWYVDYMMNNAAENKVKTSCFTYEDIPPEQIREIKPMK